MSKTFRFTATGFNTMTSPLKMAGTDESFLYIMCSKAQGYDDEIYLCKQMIIPDDKQLEGQTSVSVTPEKQYQAIAYGLAYDQQLTLFDIHTHPFSDNARFSSIDDHHGKKNAKYIAKHFPNESTMGMIVLGKGFDNFEARIWDREKDRFEPIKRIEVLGCPTQILTHANPTEIEENDPYTRHRIIPGWKQGTLENLRVFVAGLGGNGSLIFESFLALGVGAGEEGWITACDPDILEASNLPRIPYAYPKHLGKSKARIAQNYAKHKAPNLNVYCYDSGIEDEEMQAMAKEANLIIGAVDSDGIRMILNNLAARYLIPYIDLGTEIIPEDDTYQAVGQVQMFVPGQTGCLMCSSALDPSTAALDRMSEDDNAQYEQAGYIRGTNETPTPSVLHLNGVVSHLAISQLLRLIFDDGFQGKEYLHYNRQNAQMIAAAVNRDDECPVCGVHGYLGAGDEDTNAVLSDLSDLQDSKAFEQELVTNEKEED